ncbi:MAG: tetratricopeptide repeat protein [Prevotella sp.]|nr:tetratricopeptide repeat protein [Prevotella sp.]
MIKKLTISLFLTAALPLSGYAADIDAATQKKAVGIITEYCRLMQEFSGDMEKAENMELIQALCENNNISTFNDLDASKTKSIGDNSMPLYQYMMTLTSKYENNVKVKYSSPKYFKTIIQPLPLEGNEAQYAFFKVTKDNVINGQKSSSRQHIVFNATSMKVLSTTSEDYEDPQGIYFEALDLYNKKDYNAAIPLFQKAASFPRYAGRYRAQSMMGWAYLKQKNYDNAYEALVVAAEQDPLGGIVLANEMYLMQNIPAKYQSVSKGRQLLEKYGQLHDVEFPTMHLMAKKSLIELYLKGVLRMDVPRVAQLINELRDDPDADTYYKIAGLSYSSQMKSNFATDANDIMDAFAMMSRADSILKEGSGKMDAVQLGGCRRTIAAAKFNIMRAAGQIDEGLKMLEDNKDIPGLNAFTAQCFYNMKRFDKALEYYQLAANEGDARGAFITSIAYYPIFEIQDLNKLDESYVQFLQSIANDGIWLDFLTYVVVRNDSKHERDLLKHIEWNKTAVERGHVYAAYWNPFIIYRNDPCKAVTQVCDAANISAAMDNSLFNYASNNILGLMLSNKDTIALHCMKERAENNDGAACYLLSGYYMFMDSMEEYKKWLIKSYNADFVNGMLDVAQYYLMGDLGLEKDTLAAYKILKKMDDYEYSQGAALLGGIEGEYFHNFEAAKQYNMKAIQHKDPSGAYNLGELYEKGLSVERDLEKARFYYGYASVLAKGKPAVYGEMMNVFNDKIAHVDSLIATELGDLAIDKCMASLCDLTNQSYSPDKRIEMSETLLKKIFASPEVKVETTDPTGQTVVATETAQDFLLRLATVGKQLSLENVGKKRDSKNKLERLVVKESVKN